MNFDLQTEYNKLNLTKRDIIFILIAFVAGMLWKGVLLIFAIGIIIYLIMKYRQPKTK